MKDLSKSFYQEEKVLNGFNKFTFKILFYLRIRSAN